MSLDPHDLVSMALRQGHTQAEAYQKAGRSRRYELQARGRHTRHCQEEGWALRVGGREGSLFVAATAPPSMTAAPELVSGMPLRLPPPQEGSPWRSPEELTVPLASEREAFGLLEGIANVLAQEIPASELLSAVLEDGSSESHLSNSLGVTAHVRHRLSTLELWASAAAGEETVETRLVVSARGIKTLRPSAIARRLADRLFVAQRGVAPTRDRGEILLSPEVVARLIEALLPRLLAESRETLTDWRDRADRVASGAVTLVDDGRHPGGLLAAPVDGEGVPTRRVVLVERGGFSQLLAPWYLPPRGAARTSGCRLRHSWRQEPATGPTHLLLEPTTEPLGNLLESVARGYYFIEAPTGATLMADGHFVLPVAGFSLEKGRPSQPVARAMLCGSLRSFLRGVQAAARDLEFFPLAGGMLGAPSVLTTGLEVRERSALVPLPLRR